MSSIELAERFMSALQRLEQTRDVGEITPLFTEDASLNRIPQTHAVRNDVASFWSGYLSPFAQIETRFENVIVGKRGIVLEWRSRGCLRGGSRFEYQGVSILEPKGDRVKRFRTYYDATHLTGRGISASTTQARPS